MVIRFNRSGRVVKLEQVGRRGPQGPEGPPGTGVSSVVAGTGIDVDNTDPENPEVALDSATIASLALADTALQPGTVTTGDISGTIAIAQGGTGQTTANDALNALLPSQTGNAGEFLQTDGTNASWQPSTGSGQTLYEAIVAPSGGDYTTLQAAITGGATRIFVRNGTYTMTGNITVPADTIIVGESWGAIIDMDDTYNLDMTGARTMIRNIQFIDFPTTGGVRMAAAEQVVDGCLFQSSSASAIIALDIGTAGAASNSVVRGNRFIKSATSSGIAIRTTTATGTTIMTNNIVTGSWASAISASAATTSLVKVSGNLFVGPNATGTTVTLNGADSNNNCSFVDNFVSRGSTGTAVQLNGIRTVTGNTIIAATGTGMVLSATATPVSGITVSGNKFQAGATGLQINANLGVTVSGNSFLAQTTQAINVNADHVNIVGNIIQTSTVAPHATPINYASGAVHNVESNAGVPEVLSRKVRTALNTSGGTLTAGTVVIIKSVAAGDEVTTTTTASDPKVYGMVLASITNNNRGYILVTGGTTLLRVDGTADIAIGDFITTHTVAGVGRLAATGETAFAIAREAYTNNDSNGIIDAILIDPRMI